MLKLNFTFGQISNLTYIKLNIMKLKRYRIKWKTLHSRTKNNSFLFLLVIVYLYTTYFLRQLNFFFKLSHQHSQYKFVPQSKTKNRKNKSMSSMISQTIHLILIKINNLNNITPLINPKLSCSNNKYLISNSLNRRYHFITNKIQRFSLIFKWIKFQSFLL